MSANAATNARTRFTPLHYAGAVAIAVLALYWPTFMSMVAIWGRDATFAHGYAIPVISLWLFWQRREQLAAVAIAPAPATLLLCVGLGVLWLLADLLDVQVIRQAAATAMLPAALWATLGTQFVRQAFFPLAYLAFAVPFGDILVPVLMRFTTEFTVAAVRLMGVPIFREGNLFSLPSGNFEVIKACSGVRYLIASLALGTLYAGISYNSWRRRAAFVALSIVVPIIANGLRAFGIVMIAHLTQMQYAVGLDHLIYGWLFFGVVMALLFLIGNRFAEPLPAAKAEPPAVFAMTAKSWRSCAVVLLVLVSAPAVALWLRSAATRSDAAFAIAQQLPPASEQWQGPIALIDGWRAAFVEQGEAAGARYESTEGSVLLFARDYGRRIEAENALTGTALVAQEQGAWRVVQSGEVELPGNIHVRSAQVTGSDGTRLEVWIWYLVNRQLARGAVHAKWLQLRSWLAFEQPVSSIVAVAAPGVQDSEAQRLLGDFVVQYPRLLGRPAEAAP